MEQTHNYAGFWQRFLAFWVDGLILSIIGIGLSFSLGTDPFAVEANDNLKVIDRVFSLIVIIAFSILFWVYYDGATPGKKLLAIKVVHGENAQPITLAVAVIRYFSYLLSLPTLGLGYLWVAFDSKKQGWHDKIAGTYVVKTDKNPRTGLAVFITILSIIGFIAMVTYISIVQSPTVK